jgi:hypothetical protein
MNKLAVLTFILHTSSSIACDGFLPPNKLYLPVSHNSGLSELQYENVIKKVEKIYSPIAKEHGAILKLDRKWESGTVNAGTYRDERDTHWHVSLYGGLARHLSMTEDGYALVLCHEIGHHIGGAPKKIINEKPFWASTEGQSDYWATLKCLRRVFQSEDNALAIRRHDVPSFVSKECKNSFPEKKENSLCIRIAMAGRAVSKVSADSRVTPFPEFSTPDPAVVAQVFDKHPVPQCRLDSYFQGALCSKSFKVSVSQHDEVVGTCHPENGFEIGTRPLCWFRPSVAE